MVRNIFVLLPALSLMLGATAAAQNDHPICRWPGFNCQATGCPLPVTSDPNLVFKRWPISGAQNAPDRVTSAFGPRNIGRFDYHEGMDIRAPLDPPTPVWPVMKGWVERKIPKFGGVILRHENPADENTIFTGYLHLRTSGDGDLWKNLDEDEEVPVGGQLAVSGITGTDDPHLHFITMIGGSDTLRHPINPLRMNSLPYAFTDRPLVEFEGFSEAGNVTTLSVLASNKADPSCITPTPGCKDQLHFNRLRISLRDPKFNVDDDLVIDFDRRLNDDSCVANDDCSDNEPRKNGIFQTHTRAGHATTVTIEPRSFDNTHAYQRVRFRLTIPEEWRQTPLSRSYKELIEVIGCSTWAPPGTECPEHCFQLDSPVITFEEPKLPPNGLWAVVTEDPANGVPIQVKGVDKDGFNINTDLRLDVIDYPTGANLGRLSDHTFGKIGNDWLWFFTWKPVPGCYTLRATAKDPTERVGTQDFWVHVTPRSGLLGSPRASAAADAAEACFQTVVVDFPPRDHAVQANSTLRVAVRAHPNASRVWLNVNGQEFEGARGAQDGQWRKWTIDWPVPNAPGLQVFLQVFATIDGTTEAAVAVPVNVIPEAVPAVSFDSPGGTLEVGQPIKVHAQAARGIDKVVLVIRDTADDCASASSVRETSSRPGSGTSETFAFGYSVGPGDYCLDATVSDRAGASSSATTSVRLLDVNPVRILASPNPPVNQTTTVTVLPPPPEASLVRLEVYNHDRLKTTQLGRTGDNSKWEFSWPVESGKNTLTALASLPSGWKTATLDVTATDSTPPVVKFIYPHAGSRIRPGMADIRVLLQNYDEGQVTFLQVFARKADTPNCVPSRTNRECLDLALIAGSRSDVARTNEFLWPRDMQLAGTYLLEASAQDQSNNTSKDFIQMQLDARTNVHPPADPPGPLAWITPAAGPVGHEVAVELFASENGLTGSTVEFVADPDASGVPNTVLTLAWKQTGPIHLKFEGRYTGVFKPQALGWHTLRASVKNAVCRNGVCAVVPDIRVDVHDDVKPLANVKSPLSGDIEGRTPFVIAASDNIGLQRVELLERGSVLASAPASGTSGSFTVVSCPGARSGKVSLNARALDLAGNPSVVPATGVDLNIIPASCTETPLFHITAPANRDSVRNTVEIRIAPEGNATLDVVVYAIDGRGIGAGSALSQPWDSTASANGEVRVTVMVRNEKDLVDTESIRVLVSNDPLVRITRPKEREEIGGRVSVETTTLATVRTVDFTVVNAGGTEVARATVGSAPFNWLWDTTVVPNGDYRIKATAQHQTGRRESHNIPVTVNNANPIIESVRLGSFAANEPVYGDVEVVALVNPGKGRAVTSVRFEVDDVTQLELPGGPGPYYRWVWRTGDWGKHVHKLGVVARNDANLGAQAILEVRVARRGADRDGGPAVAGWCAVPTPTKPAKLEASAMVAIPAVVVPPSRCGNSQEIRRPASMLVFGGREDGRSSRALWRFDGRRWTSLTVPPGSIAAWPGANGSPQMVYDSARGKVVLVTQLQSDPRFQFMEWDLGCETWTPTLYNPGPWLFAWTASYDQGVNRTVLHVQDLQYGRERAWQNWEWDGASLTHQGEGGNKGDSTEHWQFVADGYTDRLFYHRGKTNLLVRRKHMKDGSHLGDDTLHFRREKRNERWKQITGIKNHPLLGREQSVFTYDPRRQQTYAFSMDGSLRYMSSSAAWTSVVTVAHPSGRSGAALAYDGPSDQLVLFGGNPGSGAVDETWTWQTGRFTCPAVEGEPDTVNRPPTVTVREGSVTTTPGRLLTFEASASDPDGDPLRLGATFPDKEFPPAPFTGPVRYEWRVPDLPSGVNSKLHTARFTATDAGGLSGSAIARILVCRNLKDCPIDP